MSRGAKIAIAVGLGLLAALFGLLYLNAQRDALLGGTELVEVYVASRDIPANTPLEADWMATREIPKTFLQPGSIPVSEVPDRTKIKGVTVAAISSGEQMTRTKLFEGAPPPLSADLKDQPGTVGVGVAMDDAPRSVSGMVKPGDRVDVLASFEFEKSQDEHFTEVRPLFMNVMIVSVDQHTTSTHETVVNDPNSPGAGGGAPGEVKTVTLALPPQNAQQLVLAQQLGTVWLLLRAKGDNSPHTYEIWNNERLLGAANRLWRAQDAQADMMRKIAAGAHR